MTVLVAEVGAPRAVSRSTSRIDALDWTKGALIFCMVIYHAINYSTFQPMAFRLLGFLPPSFILITGFLVGQVYSAKYDLKSWKPYARLLVRGTKLLVLFIVLNLGLCVVRERNLYEGVCDFEERSSSIFFSGNGRAGIFEVLLPIAYFLLLAPALLRLRSCLGSSIILCAGAVFLLCIGLELIGNQLKNLDLLSAGIIGMALGSVPIGVIDRLANNWAMVLLLYVLYRLCSHFLGESYAVQMLGAVVTVLSLYCCALHLRAESWLSKQMVTFGKYSLFCYLAQVAILQLVVTICGGKPDRWPAVLIMGIVTTTLLLGFVRKLHHVRQQGRVVDTIYKAIFA
jgi:fucose 4-O-acetylase-like acetyltransferase